MSGCACFLARQRSVRYLGLPVTSICHIPLGKTSWNWVASVVIVSHICARSSRGMEFRAGQTHLISDAKIADEGRPQGARLPIRLAPWGGCPQGAPLPIRLALGRVPTRGAPTDCVWRPGEGAHKGRPYRFVWPWRGHPQGAPLPIAFGALGRAPTRGAPTDSFGPGEGAPTKAASRGFVPI